MVDINHDTGLPETVIEPFGEETAKFVVNKSNALIAGQGLLNASQSKLLSLCIAMVDPINPKRDNEGHLYAEMTHKEVADRLGKSTKQMKRWIWEASIAFHSNPIILPPGAGGTKKKELIVNIAHSCEPETRDGTFKLQFHKTMEVHIVDLAKNGYAQYNFIHIRDLGKKGSPKLYELLVKAYHRKRGGTQFTKIALNDIWFSMGLTDSAGSPIAGQLTYTTRFAAFRRRILEPAVAEINQETNFKVVWKPYKMGRKIVGITFCIATQDHIKRLSGSDSSIEDQMSAVGVPKALITRFVERYEEKRIASNVLYFVERRQMGLAIKSPGGFMKYLIENDVAGLPSVANPYSSAYANNFDMIQFVRAFVVPAWKFLHKELQDEIIAAHGVQFCHYTRSDVELFLAEAKNSDVDTALLLWASETYAEDLNHRYEREKSSVV